MSIPLPRRLALSTCWNSHRHTDGYEMLTEIRELGFERVELSHGIPSYLIEGILRGLDEELVHADSVHNFCPLPAMVTHAAPNLFQPSAKRKLERNSWLRYSIRTLEFAARAKATHVVMHSGSLAFRYRSPEQVLAGPLQAGPLQAEPLQAEPLQAGPQAGPLDAGSDSPSGTDREKALSRLCRAAGKSMPRIRSLYDELLPHAKEHDLVLGIENREALLELPLDAEMTDFLASVDDPHLAYWHDTGHAEIKHRLGRLDPLSHLESLSERLSGFHLHDVNEEGRDHQPVGTGTVDFPMLRKFIRPEHLLVVELSPRLTSEQVSDSRKALLDLLS